MSETPIQDNTNVSKSRPFSPSTSQSKRRSSTKSKHRRSSSSSSNLMSGDYPSSINNKNRRQTPEKPDASAQRWLSILPNIFKVQHNVRDSLQHQQQQQQDDQYGDDEKYHSRTLDELSFDSNDDDHDVNNTTNTNNNNNNHSAQLQQRRHSRFLNDHASRPLSSSSATTSSLSPMHSLNSPITLPPTFPLKDLSPATAQLAMFLVSHLQSQQNHMLSISNDMGMVKDMVYAGGLLLKQQNKDIKSLQKQVNVHQNDISSLQNEMLQQEARLRADLIFEKQQEYLQRVHFSQINRQTRLDNIFDMILLAAILLLTGTNFNVMINDTLASVIVSLAHIILKQIFGIDPYSLRKISSTDPYIQPEHQVTLTTVNNNGLLPHDVIAADKTSPIAAAAAASAPSWSQWSSSPPPYSAATSSPPYSSTTAYITPASTAYVPYNRSLRGRTRYRRKYFLYMLFRIVQAAYLFCTCRRFLSKLGIIQSPLHEYLRVILPPPLFQFIYTGRVDLLPSWVPFAVALGLSDPSDGINVKSNSSVDPISGVFSAKNPLSRDEIFKRVYSQIQYQESQGERRPSTAPVDSNHDETLNQDHTQQLSQPSPHHQQKSAKISLRDTQIFNLVPNWALNPLELTLNAFVSSLNPFSSDDNTSTPNSSGHPAESPFSLHEVTELQHWLHPNPEDDPGHSTYYSRKSSSEIPPTKQSKKGKTSHVRIEELPSVPPAQNDTTSHLPPEQLTNPRDDIIDETPTAPPLSALESDQPPPRVVENECHNFSDQQLHQPAKQQTSSSSKEAPPSYLSVFGNVTHILDDMLFD